MLSLRLMAVNRLVIARLLTLLPLSVNWGQPGAVKILPGNEIVVPTLPAPILSLAFWSSFSLFSRKGSAVTSGKPPPFTATHFRRIP
jgi:hypothetical protein